MNDSMGAQLSALKDQIHHQTPPPEPTSQGPEEFEQQQPRPQRVHPRKRMRDNDSGFGSLGPETVTVQFGQAKASMQMSAEERKRMAESVLQQQKVANATGWADVASRFGTAALSIAGAVAMTLAMWKGVKAGSRGD